MDENTDVLLRLWGKTNREEKRKNPSAPDKYHPLLFHLLDVAHCAAVLWELLPRAIRKRFADAIGRDEQTTGTLFVLLAGLHDLGKAYPGFQKKVDAFVASLQKAGFDFPEGAVAPPHNFVSVPEVQRLFEEFHLFPQSVAVDVAVALTRALGAHHGVFPQGCDLNPQQMNARTLGKNPEWQSARNGLANILLNAIEGARDCAPPETLTEIQDLGFVPMLAAFISLADWFGSSKYFPMKGPQKIAEYIAESRANAAEAVRQSGWTRPTDINEARTFAELFGYLNPGNGVKPNELQQTVGELLQGVSAPSLWIVEQEMGAGKTEAAFSIFDDCRVKGLAHGIYIAMPTQATSNAMFTRLGDFLIDGRGERDVNLILAHSHAFLDPEYRERMQRADAFHTTVYNETEKSETDEGSLLVRSWFTARKQTLLAHYGVGTIDQSLMGALQTRHWFVRLYGLAHKVVIFDECHAYDTYMNTLLVQLIAWLTELDCTVVLLSATLPKQTRLKLAEAYCKGARAQLEAQTDPPPYPRVTMVQKGQAETAHAYAIPPKPNAESKRVTLQHLPNTPEAVKTALLEAIPEEGCAIIICNTVAGAQEMYRALQAELKPSGWNCLLFHARMPFAWRKEREEKVLELFGKESGEKRTVPRPKTLLVATQVVEQSLDIDADFMASELAPVDLILQRMGRLYRHKRARNTAEPRFALLCDVAEKEAIPSLGVWPYIYAQHTLLRSWLVLRSKDSISLPNEIEPLVQAVYDEPDPQNLPADWTKELSDHKQILESKQKDQKKHAERVSVSLPLPTDLVEDWLERQKPDLKDDDDPDLNISLKALTRDGEPSLTVICCGTDADGNALAPDPQDKVTLDQVIAMMEFSLPVAQKALYHALVKEPLPKNWKEDAHLKYCRRIIFDKGFATIGKKRLRLSIELGLEIEGAISAEAEE